MNFNAWMDSDYFWLYAILTVWFSIAAVLAYNESIEKHQKFVFFDFVALVLKKTVVVAFNRPFAPQFHELILSRL